MNIRSIEGSVGVSVRPAATMSFRVRSPVATTAPVKVVVRDASGSRRISAEGGFAGIATPGDPTLTVVVG